MNIFQRAFGRLFKKSLITPPSVPHEKILRRGFWPFFMRGDYTLQNSELIFAAVSRISNALSAMPIHLYRASTLVKNSDLGDIISSEPNINMTSCQWFKTMEACRCTYGNAYALKNLDGSGALVGLDIIDPSRVTPILNETSGEMWYRIIPDKGEQFLVHGYYVVHIPFISVNGYTGVNPVSVLLNTLKYNDAIQDFSITQLEKGVNAQIVIEAPANLGQDQKKRVIEDFLEFRKLTGNMMLLESGLTARTLNLSPVDTELFEAEKITRSKVAMVYNIPPHLLGDYSDTSFSSQEQQMLEFLTLTMLPIVTAYEQELNRKLLTRDERRKGLNFKFTMESILRADSATRADVHQKAIRGGWMSVNEVRKDYGLPNDTNGHKLLVARDLTTLEYLVKNPDKGMGGSGGTSGGENGNLQSDGGKESATEENTRNNTADRSTA